MAAPTKLSKLDRKVMKKQRQAQATLFKHDNIHTVDYPTHHVVVANGGLGNDVKAEDLNRIFQTSGDLLDVVMQPSKPYAFVSFMDADSAASAIKAIHGRPFDIDGRKVFLYLNYIEKVPGVDIPHKHTGLPPGLILLRDYISPDYEQELLDCIDWNDLDENSSFDGKLSLKHRKVKHYGYEFLYGTNNVDLEKPLKLKIPSECDRLVDRLMDDGYLTTKPDQLTVNKYEAGQGIPPHVDTPSAFEDRLTSISLGTQVVMDFTHPDGRTVPVLLPPRSVLIMTGESRYMWSHGITPRKSDILPISEMTFIANSISASASTSPKLETIALEDTNSSHQVGTGQQNNGTISDRLTLVKRGLRVSLTFRKTVADPDNYAPFQDFLKSSVEEKEDTSLSKKSVLKTPASQEDAKNMESEHVHQVYEEIAGHFSDTRHTMWPQVAEFLRSLPEFSFVADVGCGNGKYLQGDSLRLLKVGCDRSLNLCEICSDRGFPVFVCDALHVPLKSESFDACISIAVIHHMSTEERRLQAVNELLRILKPGGMGLIYVWALEQERNNEKSNYLKQTKKAECSASDSVERNHSVSGNETEEALPVHTNRTQFKAQDLLVPWHLRKKDEKPNLSSTETSNTNHAHLSSKTFLRYYHVFVEGELENLIRKSHNNSAKIIKSYYDKGNWCVIFQKTGP